MGNLRHWPLAFWVTAGAVLAVTAVVVLWSAPDRGDSAPALASAAQQRHELLEVRSHLALLVTLGRDPGPELALESAAVAVRARDAATRSPQALADGYLELASELDGLAELVRARFGGDAAAAEPGQAGGGHAAGDVRLSQLETAPTLPDLPARGEVVLDDAMLLAPGDLPAVSGEAEGRSEVALRLTRILALADRLVPLTW
jgi:hypothetical protein